MLFEGREVVLERKSGWRRDGSCGVTGATQVLLVAYIKVGTYYATSRTLRSSQDEATIVAVIVIWDKEVAVSAPTLGADLSGQQKGQQEGLLD